MSTRTLLFVTGTDTGIGKTFVSSLLVRGLRERGLTVAAIKPVESGCERDSQGQLRAADAERLWDAMGRTGRFEDVIFDRLELAVSPAIAAVEEGVTLDLESYAERIAARTREADFTLVEGAGGLFSPLSGDQTFADLISLTGNLLREAVPKAVVVVGSRLGALNHAALTFDALERRHVSLLGYVLNHPFRDTAGADDPAVLRNAAALEKIARRYAAPCLGVLSHLEERSPGQELYPTAAAREIIAAVAQRVRPSAS